MYKYTFRIFLQDSIHYTCLSIIPSTAFTTKLHLKFMFVELRQLKQAALELLIIVYTFPKW